MTRAIPPIYDGKIIPRNFGHIGHLPGSKMIDDKDKLFGEPDKMIKQIRDPNRDYILVTEKIDGMNAGVIKKDGYIYAINRKGYDVRSVPEENIIYPMMQDWADYVYKNIKVFDYLLKEGERMVFENAMYTHTLRYKFKGSPIFLLDAYTADNKPLTRRDLVYKDYLIILKDELSITLPPVLVKSCVAIHPQLIIDQCPKGLVGSRDGIEGVVYQYYHDDILESKAKFVSNAKMGMINVYPTTYNGFSYDKIRCKGAL